MRSTFDRLVGPVGVKSREPERDLVVLGSRSDLVLVPVRLGDWRVETARRPRRDLHRQIAEFTGYDTDDTDVTAAAARFGLRGRGMAVDSARAVALLQTILRKLRDRTEPPIDDPLITFEHGRDPDVLAKLSGYRTLTMETADYVAEAIEWCIARLNTRQESREWQSRANDVARRWLPKDGVGALYALVRKSVQRKPRLPAESWVPVFAYSLLARSGRTNSAPVLWHALVVLAPLLLVLAESTATLSRERPRVFELIDRVDRWRDLAREADAWNALLDALTTFDEDMADSRAPRQAISTDGIKSSVRALRDAVPRWQLDPDQFLLGIGASDTRSIRLGLRTLLMRRLEVAGVDRHTPAGTLITLEAAVLLSVQAAFDGKSCIECGDVARASGRCTAHLQARWRQAKKDQRRRRSNTPARARRTS